MTHRRCCCIHLIERQMHCAAQAIQLQRSGNTLVLCRCYRNTTQTYLTVVDSMDKKLLVTKQAQRPILRLEMVKLIDPTLTVAGIIATVCRTNQLEQSPISI